MVIPFYFYNSVFIYKLRSLLTGPLSSMGFHRLLPNYEKILHENSRAVKQSHIQKLLIYFSESEQPCDDAVFVDVNLFCGRHLRKSRKRHDVA